MPWSNVPRLDEACEPQMTPPAAIGWDGHPRRLKLPRLLYSVSLGQTKRSSPALLMMSATSLRICFKEAEASQCGN